MRKIFIFWGPLVLYAALLVYFSLTPTPPEGPHINQIDKLYHFTAYSILGALLSRAVASGSPAGPSPARSVLFTALAGFSFGVLMEIGQTFVPERSAEALDALANGAGSLFGASVYWRFFHRQKQIGGPSCL